MPLSLRLAGLISTTVQGILYGAAVVMYIMTIWILLQKGRHRNLNWKMISAACALLILATAEMVVNIVRISEGFVSVGPFLPDGPESYFQNVAETTFVIKSVLYNAQTLILDGVVIYRTYIVWQSVWPVLVPICGWFGLLAAVIGTNVALVQARSGHESDVFFVATGRWITANYAATLATNLSASCLLAYRIYSLNRSVSSIRLQNQLSPVVRAVIESGLIYSMTITSALIAFVVKSPGVYVVLDLISPIILITFCMIIVRIGMAQHTSQSHSSTANGTSVQRTGAGHAEQYDLHGRRLTLGTSSKSAPLAFGPTFSTTSMTMSGNRELYDMKPLAVEVTQFSRVETDGDGDVDVKYGSGTGTEVGTESVYSTTKPRSLSSPRSPSRPGSAPGQGREEGREEVHLDVGVGMGMGGRRRRPAHDEAEDEEAQNMSDTNEMRFARTDGY